ncbi:MAG: hypothetical protein LBV19_10610, partial [Streptococcaceae bacterium]|nr:hypothetical protein [Streptococcaceae bacterium]
IVEPASAIQNDLKNNFQNITNMLSDIDSAVSLIEFLYGAPDTSSGNLEKYTAFTSRSETTDFTDHSSESVYNKYDNIDFSEVKDRLSSADVHDFMAEGQRNLELLVGTIKIADDENHTVTITGQGQIQKILEVREDLQADSDTLNQNLPADYFADSLAQITNWYNETVTVLNTAYKAWLPNTANQLDLIDWPSVAPSTTTSFDASEDQSTSDEAAVEYYSYPDTVGEKLEMPENDPVAEEIRRLLEGRSTDNESGDEETDAPAETTPDTSTVDPDGLHLYTSQASLDELYQSFETLYSNSESVAKSTSASAEEIEDNAEEFDTLVKQTQTTGTEADNVLKETSKILQSGNLALEKSKDYYQNFQKTLANTRDEKADTNTIYDFFANPIKALNLSTAAKLIRSFDWRWIVVFVFGLVLGMTAMWMKKAPSAKLENGNSDMDVEDWE